MQEYRFGGSGGSGASYSALLQTGEGDYQIDTTFPQELNYLDFENGRVALTWRYGFPEFSVTVYEREDGSYTKKREIRILDEFDEEQNAWMDHVNYYEMDELVESTVVLEGEGEEKAVELYPEYDYWPRG